MAGFMNAELERIRDNLRCGHCEAIFKGSDSQARKVKYEKLIVYCSTVCRHAALKNKFGKPLPNQGPCRTCGNVFFSKTAKKFCTLDCYIKSEQFIATSAAVRAKAYSPESRAKNAETRKKGKFKPCLECGADVYEKPATPRKFCSKPCHRAYMAKRFDRWIANPEGLALPQCYDEFLDRQELTCPIDGCSWHGQWLTLHVNRAHGLAAPEFKRAAGFNLSSGIISRPLAELLCARQDLGVALNRYPHGPPKADPIRYRSKESIEHYQKARATSGLGPQRECAGCGNIFIQSTPFGRARYCSPTCRDASYAAHKKASAKKRIRRDDGTFRWV